MSDSTISILSGLLPDFDSGHGFGPDLPKRTIKNYPDLPEPPPPNSSEVTKDSGGLLSGVGHSVASWFQYPGDSAYDDLPNQKEVTPFPNDVEGTQGEFSKQALSILSQKMGPEDKLQSLRDVYAGRSWTPEVAQDVADTAQHIRIEGGIPLNPHPVFAAYAMNSRVKFPGDMSLDLPNQRDEKINTWNKQVKAEMQMKGGVDYALSANENNAFVDSLSNGWKREGNHASSPMQEYLTRFFTGAADTATSLVGAQTDLSKTKTDPRYDDDHLAQLMSGLGNGAVDVGAVLGTAELGGVIAAGRGVSIGTGKLLGSMFSAVEGSVAQNYQSTWEDIYSKTGSREAATKAAFRTWPSWALDSLSTMVEAKGLGSIVGAASRGAKIESLAGVILGEGLESGAVSGVTGTARDILNQQAEAPFTGADVSPMQAVRAGLAQSEVGAILGAASGAIGHLNQPHGVPGEKGSETQAPPEPQQPMRPGDQSSTLNGAKSQEQPGGSPATPPPIVPPLFPQAGEPTVQGLPKSAPQAADNQASQAANLNVANEPLFRIPDVSNSYREVTRQIYPGTATREGATLYVTGKPDLAGSYSEHSGLITTDEIGNLGAHAHEAGHTLLQTAASYILPRTAKEAQDIQASFWGNQNLDPQVEKELIAAGEMDYPKATFPDGPPSGDLRSEGMGKIAQMELTGNAESTPGTNAKGDTADPLMAQQFPNARKWFNESLLNQVATNIDKRKSFYEAQRPQGIEGKLAAKRPIDKLLADTSGQQFLSAWQEAKKQGRGFYGQSLEQKALAIENRDKVDAGPRDRFMNWFNKATEDPTFQYIDKLVGLKRFQQFGENIVGERLPQAFRAYDSAVAAFGLGTAHVKNAFVGTMTKLGSAIPAHDQNFTEAIAPWATQHDTNDPKIRGDFSNYINAQRAKYFHTLHLAEVEQTTGDLIAKGVTDPEDIKNILAKLPDHNPGMTIEQAQSAIDQHERTYPELAGEGGVGRRMEGWSNAFLESTRGQSRSADAHIDNIQLRDEKVRKFDPTVNTMYSPLSRDIGEGYRGFPGAGQLGSQRQIDPVFEGLPMAATAWANHVLRSRSVDRAIALADAVPGLGRYLTRLAMKPPGIEVNTGDEYGAPVIFDKGNELAYLRRREPDGEGGLKDTWYEADKKLAAGLQKGDTPILDWFNQNQLIEYGGKRLKKAAQMGFLGLNGAWMLGTFIPRGAMEIHYLRGENDITLTNALSTYFGTMGRAGLDAMSFNERIGKDRDPLMKFMDDQGWKQQTQTMSSENYDQNENLYKKMLGRGYEVGHVKNWWDATKALLNAPEVGRRGAFARFEAMRNLGGDIDPNRVYTPEESEKMFFAWREGIGDHARSGNSEWSQVATMLTPFLGGNVQGTRRIAEAMRTPTFWKRAGAMSLGAGLLTLWHRQNDSEWWDEIPDGQKYKYWFMKVPGTKTIMRIPKAFQLDAPASAVEAGIDAMGPEGVNRFKGFFLDGMQYDSFGVTNMFAAPALRATLNQLYGADIKTDAPIETDAMRRLAKPDHFNDYTTETAKFLGRTFNQSPARIEKLTQDLTGYSILGVVKAVESLTGLRKLPPGATPDLQLFGGLFPTHGVEFNNGVSVQKFYDNLSQINFKLTEDPNINKDLRGQMRDAAKAESILGGMMKQLPIGSDERQKIYEKRLEIAKSANKAFEARNVDRKAFKEFKKGAIDSESALRKPPQASVAQPS